MKYYLWRLKQNALASLDPLGAKIFLLIALMIVVYALVYFRNNKKEEKK
jgi:hypothetical protein